MSKYKHRRGDKVRACAEDLHLGFAEDEQVVALLGWRVQQYGDGAPTRYMAAQARQQEAAEKRKEPKT